MFYDLNPRTATITRRKLVCFARCVLCEVIHIVQKANFYVMMLYHEKILLYRDSIKEYKSLCLADPCFYNTLPSMARYNPRQFSIRGVLIAFAV